MKKDKIYLNSSLIYHGKTDLEKLHAIALMEKTILESEDKLFYYCHLIAGTVMLSEDIDNSMVIVITRSSRYAQKIQRMLNMIFDEYNLSKMDFGSRQTYGYGLFSTEYNTIIKFCSSEKDLESYDEYFLVDTRK